MADHPTEPRIVNIDAPEWSGTDPDGGRWKRLAKQAGGSLLGCTLEEIQPGGSPAAYHYHLANEEAVYVVDGHGSLRTPGGTHPIEPGDYVPFPAGASGAHAIENTSDAVLRVLFFSTMSEPDVVVYPDEGEFHLVADVVPGRRSEEGTLESTFPFDDMVTREDA